MDTIPILYTTQDMSRSNRDNVYCQASFSKAAWTLTVKIMDLFEQGKIKDQKLSIRQLTSKPDFKQQYLQPVQCLPDSFKLQILTSVAEKDMSFSELKKAATDYRAEQAVQNTFCKCTNTTWEGACRRYPHSLLRIVFSNFLVSILASKCHKHLLHIAKQQCKQKVAQSNLRW